MNKGRLIIMVGLPASGKSTWARDYINTHENVMYNSSDDIRIESFGENYIYDAKDNQMVFRLMNARTKEGLKNGKTVIYDACNISRKKRMSLIREMKPHCDEVICVFKYKPYNVCIIDNLNRENNKQVPQGAMDCMYASFKIPSYSEGFTDIIIDYNIVNIIDNPTNIDVTHVFDYEQYCDLLETIKLHKCVEYCQNSKYHSLSLSRHMYHCYRYTYEHTNNKYTIIASMLHDIGKPFCCKVDEDYKYNHYYGHENVSAYDSIKILYNFFNLEKDDVLTIALLINSHMDFINVPWIRIQEKLGLELFNELHILHIGDKLAK